MPDKNSKKQERAYMYTTLSSYRSVSIDDLSEFTERVRTQVVPKIKKQIRKKETGAQRARMKRVF